MQTYQIWDIKDIIEISFIQMRPLMTEYKSNKQK